MSPRANSKNGILCDFVPPKVTIKISAARHVCIHANNFRKRRILKQKENINRSLKLLVVLEFDLCDTE